MGGGVEQELTGLHEGCADTLPTVALREREAILDGPTDAVRHAALLSSLPFARTLEVRTASAGNTLARSARVVAWNLQRGLHVLPAAALLERTGADVLLLSELDCGMARTSQRHATRELADALGCGYAYAVEYLELGLGDAAEQLRYAGASNRSGYHGGAILCRTPLDRPALVRLEASGSWFDGSRGECRVGGRIAVLGTLKLGGIDVVFAAVHLDSHGEPDERAQQLAMLIDAIDRYRPGAPALIGGDLNTFSFGATDSSDPTRLQELLAEDSGRLAHPVPHEPLFDLAAERGYAWARCNVLREPTQRVAHEGSSHRGGLKIDWFLSRGLNASRPEVIPGTDSEVGALSDHEPIAVTVTPA